ncbi:hypothetical protein [Luteolibacter sp. Populi]|uniref:hypothetical protein n=1 Tax=Luteolibacter sp. Populi TaxID=3230487 RepID=UPI0034672354
MLRLLYNLILLVPGLAVIAVWVTKQQMPLFPALIFAAMMATGANACFLLGPLAELYLRGLFRRGEGLGRGRWLMFWAGVVLSLGVFLLVFLMGLPAWATPDQT